LDLDELPKLTDAENAALEKLAAELPVRLRQGEWIVERLRYAIEQRDQAAIAQSLAHLLRSFGGNAKGLIRQMVPRTLDVQDLHAILKQVLIGVCHKLNEFDPTKKDLRTWFLQAVCQRAAEVLTAEVHRKRAKRLRSGLQECPEALVDPVETEFGLQLVTVRPNG